MGTMYYEVIPDDGSQGRRYGWPDDDDGSGQAAALDDAREDARGCQGAGLSLYEHGRFVAVVPLDD